LTDDFSMRLKALLKELPRDLHYCALGYGRPKTAPIVSYSDLLILDLRIRILIHRKSNKRLRARTAGRRRAVENTSCSNNILKVVLGCQ
jgi:hypothetical protein